MDVNLTGAEWFKSSHSQGTSECVEVAWLADGAVGVRDSKHPTGPALIFAPADWDAFTSSVKHDRLTDPIA
ncbi:MULTISPECIES: DUF397 domain-containing protein [Nocardia]|uniref:DUF397 domain-containing protein n=1 Tax=Nocardia nova TaxID=37330 RepID=A0A2T2Z930_9NOCA|nr:MULTISPECIES: DUF397 domain-containing protein [Nocardia]PSR64265.1 DUF397 domain-containing protein [Nocardia nova]